MEIYPQRVNFYPLAVKIYPPRVERYPPAVKIYPQRVNFYPRAVNIYSPRVELYPPAVNIDPPRVELYPPAVKIYPPRVIFHPRDLKINPSSIEDSPFEDTFSRPRGQDSPPPRTPSYILEMKGPPWGTVLNPRNDLTSSPPAHEDTAWRCLPGRSSLVAGMLRRPTCDPRPILGAPADLRPTTRDLVRRCRAVHCAHDSSAHPSSTCRPSVRADPRSTHRSRVAVASDYLQNAACRA